MFPDIVRDGDKQVEAPNAERDVNAISTGATDKPPEISLRRLRAASAG